MIDIIIGALKLSLNDCNKIDHPAEYVYEINQVLNRFKTNLFKRIPDKTRQLYDPKEFIQLRICMGWKIYPTHGAHVGIKERSPIMLHINGFVPELGIRNNRERSFIKAVDISDVIDLEKNVNVKSDYYSKLQGDSLSEAKLIHEHIGHDLNQCIFYDREGRADGVYEFTMQIAAMVFLHEDKDFRSFVQASDNPKSKHAKDKQEFGREAGLKSAELRAAKAVTPEPRFFV